MNKPEDSLKKRYFFKLSTNLFNLAIGLLTAGITPRALGPAGYGSYSYLTSFFNQIVSFLDMGTSIGFYSKLSQRQDDTGLVSFYSRFVGLVTLAIFFFVALTLATPMHKYIWPAQPKLLILFAAGWGVLYWLGEIFNKMTDAYAMTVPAELSKMLQRGIGALLLVALFFFGRLNIYNYFVYQYFMWALLSFLFVRLLVKRRELYDPALWKLTGRQALHYLKEFYQYSHPLFVYALLAMLTAMLGRWILQLFGGSVQQGFYGLSYTIGTYCFLFTMSMQPLLMREFSVAHGNLDLARMGVLFRKYIPLLYSIAAYFACFIAVEAPKVIYIFGGQKYQAAVLPVAIMAFYPIHQTYGQLSGAVFYATGQTKLYRNIGIFFMLLGLPLTYLMIAPPRFYGLGAGAVGLAVAMIASQFLAVNTQLYFNSKYLKLTFWKYLAHQVGSVMVLAALAALAALAGNALLGADGLIVPNFIFSGLLYTGAVAGLSLLFPIIFGLERDQLRSLLGQVKKRLRGA